MNLKKNMFIMYITIDSIIKVKKILIDISFCSNYPSLFFTYHKKMILHQIANNN